MISNSRKYPKVAQGLVESICLLLYLQNRLVEGVADVNVRDEVAGEVESGCLEQKSPHVNKKRGQQYT